MLDESSGKEKSSDYYVKYLPRVYDHVIGWDKSLVRHLEVAYAQEI